MYPNHSTGKSTASLIVWLLNSLMTRLHAGATITQNPLGTVIMSLNDLIRSEKQETRDKQQRLSEVAHMIHAAHVFHRCDNPNQDPITSLLVGDYLLAQSSVDLADLRSPLAMGIIAKSLEDYTRGEFMKLKLFEDCLKNRINPLDIRRGIEKYAELTCGSLLSSACLSTAILAGYPNRSTSGDGNSITTLNSKLSDLVYKFGFHTGSAHRLTEFLYCPETNGEADKAIKKTLDIGQFEESIRNHIDKSKESLLSLPDGEKRSSLLTMLDGMIAMIKNK